MERMALKYPLHLRVTELPSLLSLMKEEGLGSDKWYAKWRNWRRVERYLNLLV